MGIALIVIANYFRNGEREREGERGREREREGASGSMKKEEYVVLQDEREEKVRDKNTSDGKAKENLKERKRR